MRLREAIPTVFFAIRSGKYFSAPVMGTRNLASSDGDATSGPFRDTIQLKRTKG